MSACAGVTGELGRVHECSPSSYGWLASVNFGGGLL